jgi:hypothetical protein
MEAATVSSSVLSDKEKAFIRKKMLKNQPKQCNYVYIKMGSTDVLCRYIIFCLN